MIKRTILTVIAISLFIGLFVAPLAPVHAQGLGEVNYQTFYDELSPYGTWVSDPVYGYVWAPNAGPDFQPYRGHGHWVYTDYGWTWVSDYHWGWAAFHYGRWRFSDPYGWIWIPGYTWGPAWVSWRSSQGYYGWAPLGPTPPHYGYVGGGGGGHISIGFNFSWGNAAPANQWCFVASNYVASPYVANYYVPPTQATTIYNNTTIIKNTVVNGNVINNNGTIINNNSVNNSVNNTTSNTNNSVNNSVNQKAVYIAGPPRADVEKATGQLIAPVSITNSSKPGAASLAGNSISMYRPPVGKPSGSSASMAPHVAAASMSEVKPVNARPVNEGLVRNNPVSHINSTDPHPAQMAKQNFASYKANPAAVLTREKTRYANQSMAATTEHPVQNPKIIQNFKGAQDPNPGRSTNPNLYKNPNHGQAPDPGRTPNLSQAPNNAQVRQGQIHPALGLNHTPPNKPRRVATFHPRPGPRPGPVNVLNNQENQKKER